MDKNTNKTPISARWLFGILMILIYLGMGVLMLMNFFQWDSPAVYYSLGALFVVYGIYRGYRQFKGMDHN